MPDYNVIVENGNHVFLRTRAAARRQVMKEYQIALSLAGEERAYVEAVAGHLKAAGVHVFYDRFETVRLWGRDLAEEFQQLYFGKSEYVVMFVSKSYVRKIWPNHEKRAALAAALGANREYVLPVRFDDTELPGLNPTVSFVDARTTSERELAIYILQKIGSNLDLPKGNIVAPPASPVTIGTADFDYSSHDGRYLIGTGPYEFENSVEPWPLDL